jgi:hypothetical protein
MNPEREGDKREVKVRAVRGNSSRRAVGEKKSALRVPGSSVRHFGRDTFERRWSFAK